MPHGPCIDGSTSRDYREIRRALEGIGGNVIDVLREVGRTLEDVENVANSIDHAIDSLPFQGLQQERLLRSIEFVGYPVPESRDRGAFLAGVDKAPPTVRFARCRPLGVAMGACCVPWARTDPSGCSAEVAHMPWGPTMGLL